MGRRLCRRRQCGRRRWRHCAAHHPHFQVQAAYAAARGLDDTKLALAPLHRLVAKALTIQYRSLTADDDAAAAALYEEILRREPHSPLALIGLAARLVETSANLLCERQSALRGGSSDPAGAAGRSAHRARTLLARRYLSATRPTRACAQNVRPALKLNPSFVPAEAHAGFAMVLRDRRQRASAASIMRSPKACRTRTSACG